MKSTPPFNMDNHVESECLAFMQQAINSNNPRRIYNIKPSHQHKIRAITNLLEDLNLENLIQVKNRIINKLNGQK